MCKNSGTLSPKRPDSHLEGIVRSAARALTEKARNHTSPVGKYRASRMVRFSRFSPSTSGSLLRVERKIFTNERNIGKEMESSDNEIENINIDNNTNVNNKNDDNDNNNDDNNDNNNNDNHNKNNNDDDNNDDNDNNNNNHNYYNNNNSNNNNNQNENNDVSNYDC